MTLFRTEALEGKRRQLYGVATIHQPPSLLWLTVLVAVITVVVFILLCTTPIPQKETVSGWLTPDVGLAQVYSPKGGIATSVQVQLGQVVKQGQTLATLNTDIIGPNGSLAAGEKTHITARIAELDAQISENAKSGTLEVARLRQHADSLQSEAENLRLQQSLEKEQVDIAKVQVDRIKSVVDKGYVSEDENDRRKDSLLGREQSLADIDRQIASKMEEAQEASVQIQTTEQSTESNASKLRADRYALTQSLAEASAQGSNFLSAPIKGRISYVNLSVGQSAPPNTPLFAISPLSSPLIAEILVPTERAGFVEVGQTVRVMVDAYPFQRYGAIRGTVIGVSKAAVMPNQIASPIVFKEAAYVVKVRLSEENVETYGKARALQPGMTLKADVITDHRTLLQWVVDPLLAAKRRATE